tara:strand:+ start:332 stop:463 length:132 start_codon:yes stop_codon:yes gene_type:complete
MKKSKKKTELPNYMFYQNPLFSSIPHWMTKEYKEKYGKKKSKK